MPYAAKLFPKAADLLYQRSSLRLRRTVERSDLEMLSNLKIVASLLLLSVAYVYAISVPVRVQHCTAQLGDTLFVYGGYNGVAMNDFYSLDISQPFDLTQANFQDLSSQAAQAGVLGDCGHICFPGPDSRSFVLFGGNIPGNLSVNPTVGWFGMPKDPTVRLLWEYNETSRIWSLPVSPMSPDNSSTVVKWAGVAYDTGKTVYIFGGWNQFGVTGNLSMIDLPSMTWHTLLSSPLAVLGHTLSLTSGGLLVSIGGASSTSLGYPTNLVAMDTIYVYNTLSNQWSIQSTSSPNSVFPTPRYWHSAVITPDQRIVMYGGWTINNQPLDDVWVLNTSSNPYAWSQPVTQISIARAEHTATLIGHQMVVLFGQGTYSLLNDVQILDLNSYTWQSRFIPANLQSSPSVNNGSLTGTTSSDNSTGTTPSVTSDTSSLIIKIAVPIAVVLACVAVAGLLLYTKYKELFFFKRGPRGMESEKPNDADSTWLPNELPTKGTTQKPGSGYLKPNVIDLKPHGIDFKPHGIDFKPDVIDFKPDVIDLKPDQNNH